MNRIYNKMATAGLAVMLLAGCSEKSLEGFDNGFVSSDDITEVENLNPDALIKITTPLLLGIYSDMYNSTVGSGHNDFGWLSLGHMGDVMTDDIALHTTGNGWYIYDYQMDYWKEEYVRPMQAWLFFYSIISKSNDLLNKISPTTTNAELRATMGQCYALRGFSYFYLAQFFQQTYAGNEDKPGMPIYTSTREGVTEGSRAPLRDVYARIDADFELALELLDGWKRPGKTYIDKSVAATLYARVCLVKNDWEGAREHAVMARNLSEAKVMNQSELMVDGFNDISNQEWMWGTDITSETTTKYASFFSFMCSFDAGYGGNVGCYRKIDRKLFDSMSETDARRNQFKDPAKNYSGQVSVFPAYTNLKFRKSTGWTGDYVYMRASELYLIEAEAYAREGKIYEAANAIKPLMGNRDASWSQTAITVDQVLEQRRIELWGEGFSLFDRVRSNKGIDRSYSGSNHLASERFRVNAGSRLFQLQIPLSEINNNNMISGADQNPAPLDTDRER